MSFEIDMAYCAAEEDRRSKRGELGHMKKDGNKPDVWYSLDKNGEFVKVE